MQQHRSEKPDTYLTCDLSESMMNLSHYLVLSHVASRFSTLHGISGPSIHIFDKGQAERAAAVLVAGEFRYKLLVGFSWIEGNENAYRWRSRHFLLNQTAPRRFHESGH